MSIIDRVSTILISPSEMLDRDWTIIYVVNCYNVLCAFYFVETEGDLSLFVRSLNNSLTTVGYLLEVFSNIYLPWSVFYFCLELVLET